MLCYVWPATNTTYFIQVECITCNVVEGVHVDARHACPGNRCQVTFNRPADGDTPVSITWLLVGAAYVLVRCHNCRCRTPWDIPRHVCRGVRREEVVEPPQRRRAYIAISSEDDEEPPRRRRRVAPYIVISSDDESSDDE